MVWSPFTRKLKIFAIVFTNNNAIKDDNFNILLNGASIGTIDNNSNTITGRIFAQSDAITPTDIVYSPNNYQPTVVIPDGALINGPNTLHIDSIQNNGAGNAGTVVAGWFGIFDGDNKYRILTTDDTRIAITSYEGPSGGPITINHNYDITFTYP